MARSIESDLSPGSWDCARTAGDTDPGESFTLTVDGDELVVSDAVAQVRTARRRTADLVFERDVSFTGNVVTVGEGDEVPDEPGAHWWDLQVVGTVEGAPFGPLTVLSGEFRIVADVSDVSDEEGS